MNLKTYKLSKLDQAVEVAMKCPVFWYRGQPKTYGNLTPKVFRPDFGKARSCFVESEYVTFFQAEARGVEANCPHRDDHVAWLFLMQHHGSPTRLLDWSESILVALYFAVTTEMDEDAELWCMHPAELNKRSVGFCGYMGDDEAQVRELAKDATAGINECGQREVDVKQLPASPVAIAPSLWFRRGVNQLSRFTTHPKPGEGRAIEDTLDYPNLVRYVIRGQDKQHLEDALYCLGIRPNTMFPDLDGVSRGIYRFAERLERGAVPCQVMPPECDGQVSEHSTE